MITLWVMPDGLRRQHDPHNPVCADIAEEYQLVALADRVIFQTSAGTFILKDRHKIFTTAEKWDRGGPLDFTSQDDARVIFSPWRGMKPLEFKFQAPDPLDLNKFSRMVQVWRGY